MRITSSTVAMESLERFARRALDVRKAPDSAYLHGWKSIRLPRATAASEYSSIHADTPNPEPFVHPTPASRIAPDSPLQRWKKLYASGPIKIWKRERDYCGNP